MKIYINCRIYKSGDTAFATDGNEIIETGNNEQILQLRQEDSEIIDLQNMLVLPGFADSHMHLLSLGYVLCSLRLDGCRSLSQLAQRLQQHAQNRKEGEWLRGRGYNEEQFSDHAKPDRKFLDEAVGEIPCMIIRTCGHIAVINSAGLEKAGITEETEIAGGRIDYENGILEENAISFVKASFPSPDEKTMQMYLEKAQSYCNAKGITAVGSDDFLSLTKDYRDALNLFEKLSYQGKLNIRINEQCEFASVKEFASFLDEGYTFDVGNDFFRIGPLKLITDGSLGGRSAAMRKPYRDDEGNTGVMTMDETEIETFVRLANQFNMPTIAHAIGDRAVETMLDIFRDTVLEGNPLHHGLVHCQIMNASQIHRILKMKLSCYIQPQFIDADAGILQSRVGSKLAETSYPFRTLYEGTLTSGGSDAPVEFPDPLAAITFACTRQSQISQTKMNPQECLSVDQAIDLMCEKGYEQMFMQDRLGKIQKGYIADFTVIDRDIRQMDPARIKDAKVMMTVVDGVTVFEK